MPKQYLGEIRIMSFNFPPKGWMRCDGQVLNRSDHQDLFNLIGEKYTPIESRAETTFALPKLNRRVPIHVGYGHALGDSGGAEKVTLEFAHVAHSHAAYASSVAGGAVVAKDNFLGPGGNLYSAGGGEGDASPGRCVPVRRQ